MTYSTGLGSALTDLSQVDATDYAHLLEQLTPSQRQVIDAGSVLVYLADPFAMIAQDGLGSRSDADAIHQAVASGSVAFAEAITAHPTLAAFWASWLALNGWKDMPGLDPNLVLQGLLTGHTDSYYSGLELPAGLPASVVTPYRDAVQHYFSLLLQDYRDRVANTTNRQAQSTWTALQYARQAALARGSVTLGNGVTVAQSLIAEQVELPDGTMFVVVDDVTGDPAHRVVYTWHGPHWQPLQATGGWYEGSSGPVCQGVVPGTGSWYVARVLGQVAPGSSCDATPIGFAGPWDLLTPAMAQDLTYQSGAAMQVIPAAQQPSGGGTGGGGSGDVFANDPTVLVAHSSDPSGTAQQPVPPVPPAPFTQMIADGVVLPPGGIGPMALVGVGALVFLLLKRGR